MQFLPVNTQFGTDRLEADREQRTHDGEGTHTQDTIALYFHDTFPLLDRRFVERLTFTFEI